MLCFVASNSRTKKRVWRRLLSGDLIQRDVITEGITFQIAPTGNFFLSLIPRDPNRTGNFPRALKIINHERLLPRRRLLACRLRPFVDFYGGDNATIFESMRRLLPHLKLYRALRGNYDCWRREKGRRALIASEERKERPLKIAHEQQQSCIRI